MASQSFELDTVFFGPMIGELGWAVSRWQGWCRLRRFTEFGNLRSIAADYNWRYPLYADFVDEFIPLPDWFTNLGLSQDCYEAPPSGAPAGTVTPPAVYADLLHYFQGCYNNNTTWTVRTPRGPNFIVQHRFKQMWNQLSPSPQAESYADSLLYKAEKDIVIVSARGRTRAPERNVPEFIWDDLVNRLSQRFVVVITGVKGGAFLVNKKGKNIINVIPRTGVDGLDVLIALLRRATFSVTSQSGPTLISLLCETPSYVVGHEGPRHSRDENWLNTPCFFRSVPHNIYAGVTADVMFNDIVNFHQSIVNADNNVETIIEECNTSAKQTMLSLTEDNTINLHKINVTALRQELLNEG